MVTAHYKAQCLVMLLLFVAECKYTAVPPQTTQKMP